MRRTKFVKTLPFFKSVFHEQRSHNHFEFDKNCSNLLSFIINSNLIIFEPILFAMNIFCDGSNFQKKNVFREQTTTFSLFCEERFCGWFYVGTLVSSLSGFNDWNTHDSRFWTSKKIFFCNISQCQVTQKRSWASLCSLVTQLIWIWSFTSRKVRDIQR